MRGRTPGALRCAFTIADPHWGAVSVLVLISTPHLPGLGGLSDVGYVPTADPDEFGEGRREDRMWVPCRRPDDLVCRERRVHERGEWGQVSDRRDAADGEPSALADEIRVGPAHLGEPEVGSHLGGVDAVAPEVSTSSGSGEASGETRVVKTSELAIWATSTPRYAAA